ncbi:MAG: ribulose-phosphate 3-epimerase [candidate division Zixibacteria bacterium]|nr:ribulose-phosphate 3-epimerase [candidate division Zixibacteria bacterium]
MPLVAPSILAADFGHLADEITGAESAGVRFYHLDIMDGHFVPNISFGPGVVKTINGLTDRFLDCHLMLTEPEKYFEPFAKAGADNITFHLEVHPDPTAHARRLHDMKIQAGISINPDMPVERVLPFLEHFEYLLLMSVFPGFGGQAFMPNVIPKVEIARKFIDQHGLKTKIQIDGGVDSSNAAGLVSAGADILVMGTAFFKSQDRAGLVRSIQK